MLHWNDYCKKFRGGRCRRIGREVGRDYCRRQCAGKGMTATEMGPAAGEPAPRAAADGEAIFFRKDGTPLGLEGFWAGQSVFLVCNGPSLKGMDLAGLGRRVTMGINNGPATFRPNLWTAGDTCGKFLDSIWRDPGILKFMPLAKLGNRFWDSRRQDVSEETIADCPAVVWHRRDSGATASTWTGWDRISWGVTAGGRRRLNTMAAALHILYYLGFSRIYILGADFHMEAAEPYCFEEQADAATAAGNNELYRVTDAFFAELRGPLEAAGVRVFNCTPGGNLTAFERMDFAEALRRTEPVCNTATAGMYHGGLRAAARRAWTRGILYYSHNSLDGTPLNEACRRSLLDSGLPITAVTHRPADFAHRNLVVSRPPSLLAMLENIVEGLEAMTEDYVFLAEHDCLYAPSHFEHIDTRISYNTNAWRLGPRGYHKHPDAYPVLSAGSGPRRVLLEAMKKKLAQYRKRTAATDYRERAYAPMIFEPQRKTARRYSSEGPILDVRHRRNSASGVIMGQWEYRRNLPGWGPADALRRRLGVQEHPGWMRARDRQLLGRYTKLAVCGPQRSGTRIFAQIIADTFGLEYIDEAQFNVHSWERMRQAIEGKTHYVVQCPALTHRVFELPGDVGIVYVRRGLAEIQASQERIGWGVAGHRREKEEARERAKFAARPDTPIAQIKYEFIEAHRDGRTIELDYGSFSKHPRWVTADQRQGFAWNQTQ